MSVTVEQINGITKQKDGTIIIYYFPSGNVKINGSIINVPYNIGFGSEVEFSELDMVSKQSQTTAEDLADYWANNGFFVTHPSITQTNTTISNDSGSESVMIFKNILIQLKISNNLMREAFEIDTMEGFFYENNV